MPCPRGEELLSPPTLLPSHSAPSRLSIAPERVAHDRLSESVSYHTAFQKSGLSLVSSENFPNVFSFLGFQLRCPNSAIMTRSSALHF